MSKMYSNQYISINYTSAISGLLLASSLLFLLVQIVASQGQQAASNGIGYGIGSSQLFQWRQQQQIQREQEQDSDKRLERRSADYTIGGNGARSQVAISLERVKNPDDQPYKKKKFPITWLRNQYPFNAYYKNKKNNKYMGKYAHSDPLVGQYSHEQIEMLDPNPSTWVKIPPRPTATIKFQKQSGNLHDDSNLLAAYSQQPILSPPPSLQLASSDEMLLMVPPSLDHQSSFGQLAQEQLMSAAGDALMRPPASLTFARPPAPHLAPHQSAAGAPMMTSESQQGYSGGPAASAVAAPTAAAGEPSQGFGGISLSFGNGRSISFGGGQGLTIGGRAGAISIGGKGGGDNTPSASGYSVTNTGGNGYSIGGGASSSSGYSSTDSGSASAGNGYASDNGYVNRHPTMSMDFPRKGKTVVHANLDMAPIKLRLHTSPRIKVTTGSRDPLEKPSDEELTEGEEDIFEPPEPFPKRNTTASANETDSSSTSGGLNGTSNGNETSTTLSPIGQSGARQPDVYGKFRPQAGYGGQQRQPFYSAAQHQHQGYPQQFSLQPQTNYHQNPLAQQQQQQFSRQHEQQQYQSQVPFNEQAFGQAQYRQQQQFQQQLVSLPSPQGPQYQLQEELPQVQQQIQQLPLMQQHLEQPGVPPFNGLAQQQPVFQDQAQKQPQSQATQMTPPSLEPPPQLNQPPGGQPAIGDRRPAVNTWRQFSREARPKMSRFAPNQQDLNGDENPRFYNGGQAPNSIVEQPAASVVQPVRQQQQQPRLQSLSPAQTTGGVSNRLTQFEAPDLAASGSAGTYTKVVLPNQRASVLPIQSTVSTGPEKHLQSQPQKQRLPAAAPVVAANNDLQQTKRQPQQQQVQAQESRYHSSAYSSSSGNEQHESSYSNQQDAGKVRTYTFGSDGFSAHDDSSSSAGGYGSGYTNGASGSSGGGASGSATYYSDGFDRKNYDAKVEKFDPEAHDKRERSKVILFVKPRISIHMANSSTTTKRPKNRQRLVHTFVTPIFLNTTNTTNHGKEEEFIDPDLKEPVEIAYGHNYGYGYYGAGQASSTSTTKKPKTKTTSTTSTTVSPDSTESTTSSTGSTVDDSTTTSSTSSATDDSTTTTTTASPSSSVSSFSDLDSSSTTTTTEAPSSSSSKSSEEQESTSMSLSSSTTTTSAPDSSSESGDGSGGQSSSTTSTAAPQSSTPDDTSSSDSDDSAADLVASATESSAFQSIALSTSTTTTTTTQKPAAKAPMRARAPRPTSTTSTSTSTTTTTEPPTTATSEAPPSTESSSSTTEEPELSETSTATSSTSSTTSTSTTTTTAAPEQPSPTTAKAEVSSSGLAPAAESSESSTSEPNSSDFFDDSTQTAMQAKRSIKQASSNYQPATVAAAADEQQQPARQQPMLLSVELIDKLMSNRTLVNLMSSQLKRVIDTSRMSDTEKHNIVRQVFYQMMEEKVDFSMNNVRLAVKTVSSSYRAAVEKQRKPPSSYPLVGGPLQQKQQVTSGSSSEDLSVKGSKQTPTAIAASQRRRLAARVDLKGFGRRSATNFPPESSSSTLATDQQHSSAGASAPISASNRQQQVAGGFPAIDTPLQRITDSALEPTGAPPSSADSQADATNFSSQRKSASSSLTADRTDSSGNPIVVVLLPQEKAA